MLGHIVHEDHVELFIGGKVRKQQGSITDRGERGGDFAEGQRAIRGRSAKSVLATEARLIESQARVDSEVTASAVNQKPDGMQRVPAAEVQDILAADVPARVSP